MAVFACIEFSDRQRLVWWIHPLTAAAIILRFKKHLQNVFAVTRKRLPVTKFVGLDDVVFRTPLKLKFLMHARIWRKLLIGLMVIGMGQWRRTCGEYCEVTVGPARRCAELDIRDLQGFDSGLVG